MPGIVISPYGKVGHALKSQSIGAVISILGAADRLDWPGTNGLKTLRLKFDDAGYSSGDLVAPTRQDIADIIDFARAWDGSSDLLVHCRAGTSRSPAAAMIAIAAIDRFCNKDNLERLLSAKAYYQPNRTMLRHADGLLSVGLSLSDVAKYIKCPSGGDEVDISVTELKATSGRT